MGSVAVILAEPRIRKGLKAVFRNYNGSFFFDPSSFPPSSRQPCLPFTCTWPLCRSLRLHQHRKLLVRPLCATTRHVCVPGALPGGPALQLLHLQLLGGVALPRSLLPTHLLHFKEIRCQPVGFRGQNCPEIALNTPANIPSASNAFDRNVQDFLIRTQ